MPRQGRLHIPGGYYHVMELNALLMDVPDVFDLPIYSVSARLNYRPVTTKGMRGSECLWPDKAMKEWIEELKAEGTKK